MKIPKRYKLHEATGEDDGTYNWGAVLLTGDKLVASDGTVLVVVPILPADDVSERDLPRLEPSDHLPDRPLLLPLAAVKAAVQGKTGEGQLAVPHVAEGSHGHRTALGRAGDGKPWTSAPLAEGEFPASWAEKDALPAPAQLGDMLKGSGIQLIEIIFDPERLVKAARAIGAAAGLRVRFYVRDGKLADDAPMLELRPVDAPEDGPWAALGGQVVLD